MVWRSSSGGSGGHGGGSGSSGGHGGGSSDSSSRSGSDGSGNSSVDGLRRKLCVPRLLQHTSKLLRSSSIRSVGQQQAVAPARAVVPAQQQAVAPATSTGTCSLECLVLLHAPSNQLDAAAPDFGRGRKPHGWRAICQTVAVPT